MADDPSLFGAPPAPSPKSTGNDPSGHRSRLSQRLLEGNDDALGDHEVIELLLMQAVPRRDMKPLARTLLDRFGSLAGVLTADARTLAAHPGMGEATAAALKIVVLAARRLAKSLAGVSSATQSPALAPDVVSIDPIAPTPERIAS